MTLGDFNARVQARQDELEESIGPHTFDANNVTLSTQSDAVAESRRLFITYLEDTYQLAMNTFFRKRDDQLLTYRSDKQHGEGPPYSRAHYEVLDYVLIPRNWKGCVINVTNDRQTGVICPGGQPPDHKVGSRPFRAHPVKS